MSHWLRVSGMLVVVLGITLLPSVSVASPAPPAVPALTCPSATSVGCPGTGAVIGGSGAVGGMTTSAGEQPGFRTHAAAASLVARTFPPRDVTCCSARLEGAVSALSGLKRIEVSAYFKLERDGGPQPVEQYSTTARSTGKPGTYGFYGSFLELPSCSTYRYWIIGREGRERTTGGPQSFSTSCPRRYIAWSIGQLYLGAPRSAPALGTLDTEPAAKALGGALSRLGYQRHVLLGGQQPSAILREASAAAVIAIFDHANAGNILTQGDGTNLCKTEGLVASAAYTFTCARSAWLRFGALPAFDLWSVRLMIFAGCNTANTATNHLGNLLQTATSLGVGTVVGFRDDVYYPSSARNAAAGSGDYFWGRFARYVRRGTPVGVALQEAERDLVRQTGRTWGYDGWAVSGASHDPGSLRLTLPGARAAATEAPPSARGRDGEGDVVSYTASATTHGATKLSAASARAAAWRFLARQDPHLGGGRLQLMAERRLSHEPDEMLEGLEFRSRHDGIPGPAVAELEVDLRSGAVVYLAAGQVVPSSSRFAISRRTAIRAALAVFHDAAVRAATRDVWSYPRWTVKLRPRGSSVTALVEVDGVNGCITGIDDAYA